MTTAEPDFEKQVVFLRNIQRLLAEGQFTASYKYALLLALADLAVEEGKDSGASLVLPTSRIAEKFIEFYWHQSRPYETAGEKANLILKQNNLRQATVITAIIRAQEQAGSSLFELQTTAPRAWRTLVTKVDRTVRKYPLRLLQTVGSERLDFLYDYLDEDTTTVTLKPDSAFCLRAFHDLLLNLVQASWVRFVQKLNDRNLGNLTDLGSFLFGHERGDLEAYRPILQDVQKGQCFYCGEALKRTKGEVDHFVPWSRYPTDLGHNFVLAHSGCNNAKSDHIAAEEHLRAWIEQNREHAPEIGKRLTEAALPHDLSASERIAEWAYEQTEQASGQVWVERRVFEHLGPDWRRLLVA